MTSAADRLLQRPSVLGVCALVVVLGCLAIRIGIGVDLSDEAYYAIFLDDWLKGGVRSSRLLTLHQTAALLVYPAAKVFVWLNGSSTGLYLFLRGVYLASALLSSTMWWLLCRALGREHLGWAVAVAALAFIPFGLPAPSYNTLSLHALSVALAAFGLSQAAQNSPSSMWIIVSAGAWSVATVAYPTLVVAAAAFGVAVLVIPDVSGRRRYALSLALAHILAMGIVVSVLGWSKLEASYTFLSKLNMVGDWTRKLGFAVAVGKSHPVFVATALVALVGGALSRAAPNARVLIIVVCTLVTIVARPALFMRSHDLILLLTLSGIGQLRGLRTSATRDERLMSVLYASGLACGLLTTATATNGLYNFAVGGAPAAFVSLLSLPPLRRRAEVLAPALAGAALLLFSMTSLYGDDRTTSAPRRTLREGIFAGLSLAPRHAALLEAVYERFGPSLRGTRTIAGVGRLPGLLLATTARAGMPSVFPLAWPRQVAVTAPMLKEAPADAVIVFEDRHMVAINPYGADFERLYVLEQELAVGGGRLALYLRRAQVCR